MVLQQFNFGISPTERSGGVKNYIRPSTTQASAIAVTSGLLAVALVTGAAMMMTNNFIEAITIIAVMGVVVGGGVWLWRRKPSDDVRTITTLPRREKNGESMQNEQVAIDDEDCVLVHYYWLTLSWWLAATMIAVLSLVLSAEYGDSDESLVLSFLIIFATASTIAALLPLISVVWTGLSKLRNTELSAHQIRLRIAAVLLVVLGVVVFAYYKQYDARWLWGAVTTMSSMTWEAVMFVCESFVHYSATMLVLVMIKLGFIVLDWRINPMEVYLDRIEQPAGIIRKTRATAKYNQIADYKIFSWRFLPWYKIRLTNAEQDQSVELIGWLPKWSLEFVEDRLGNRTSLSV